MSDYRNNREYISQSELKAMHERPQEWRLRRIGALPAKLPTDDMRIGTMLHKFILQQHEFHESYVVMPAFQLSPENKTKQGKRTDSTNTEFYREAVIRFHEQNLGKEIIEEQELHTIEFMAESIATHAEANKLLSDYDSIEQELYGEWRGVKIKGQLDILKRGNRIVDLKKTKSADPIKFGYSIVDFGYDVQVAMYMLLCELNGFKIPSTEFYFVCVEETSPYRVSVQHTTEQIENGGLSKLKDLLDEYKRRTEEDDWLLSWQTGVVPVQVPRSYDYQKEMIYE